MSFVEHERLTYNVNSREMRSAAPTQKHWGVSLQWDLVVLYSLTRHLERHYGRVFRPLFLLLFISTGGDTERARKPLFLVFLCKEKNIVVPLQT